MFNYLFAQSEQRLLPFPPSLCSNINITADKVATTVLKPI